MDITSWQFLALIAVTLTVYILLPQKYRWTALLAASIVFYAAGGAAAMAYLLVTSVTTYFCARCIDALAAKRANLDAAEKKATRPAFDRKRHILVAAACLINFGMLFAVKYFDGVIALVTHGQGPALGLIVPVGISFYIFQSVGYVIDVSRGKARAERNYLKYLLFVSFFPQMVQGPIDRFGHLHPQLMEGRRPTADNARDGIQLMMWGFFKKLVIAGRAGTVVNAIYSDAGAYPGSAIAFAVLMYTIELYCDFSGGIDIVRGTAEIFGIDMAENFKRPFFATSLAEFWRRWHITLGAWMRDYVFYPLSLSRAFAALGRFSRKHINGTVGRILPTSLATFIIYFIIGIWHGANLTYLAYGFYNGGIITLSIILAPFYGRVRKALRVNEESGLYRAFCVARTFFVVFVGRYFVRAPWLKMSFVMLKRTVCDFYISALWPTVTGLGMTLSDLAVVLAGFAVILAFELIEERGINIRESLAKRGFFVQWTAMVLPLLVILLLGVLGGGGGGEFIYGRI